MAGEKVHPIFCAVCPGWVCYAEKTRGKRANSSLTAVHSQSDRTSVVSCLSKVRSPQQIAGSIIKRSFTDPTRVYHATVMPCFDKKLEASRKEFAVNEGLTSPCPDVDLVMGTNEFVDILCQLLSLSESESSRKLDHQDRLELDRLSRMLSPYMTVAGGPVPPDPPVLYRAAGSGSGGYAAVIFSTAARLLFYIELPHPFELQCLFDSGFSDTRVWDRTLHSDLVELLLFATDEACLEAKLASDLFPNSERTPYRSTGLKPEPLLAFAIANGFRNIQNILMPLNPRSCKQTTVYPFDYVEIMACPGGCLNGGGQIKGTLKGAYGANSELPISQFTGAHGVTRRIYDFISAQDPTHQFLWTTYREIEPVEIINPSTLQW